MRRVLNVPSFFSLYLNITQFLFSQICSFTIIITEVQGTATSTRTRQYRIDEIGDFTELLNPFSGESALHHGTTPKAKNGERWLGFLFVAMFTLSPSCVFFLVPV